MTACWIFSWIVAAARQSHVPKSQRSKFQSFPKVNFSNSASFATEAKAAATEVIMEPQPKDIKEGGSGSCGVDKSAAEKAAAQLPKADLLTFWLSCNHACWPAGLLALLTARLVIWPRPSAQGQSSRFQRLTFYFYFL